MIVATAGHVDHGKTSLVRQLTGVDTDRLAEEKRRGLSIELGFAYRDAPGGTRLGFIDVPGHARFINTMIAGVGGIDLALLVVAADDGIMPQTVEHLDVLRLLGIADILPVISRIDRVGPERVAAVADAVRELLGGIEPGALFEVSSQSGEGIDRLQRYLEERAACTPPRDDSGYFRLSVDRAFVLKGTGLVLTGTTLSGTVNVGDELTLLPGHAPLRLRSLHADGRPAQSGRAGQRCALNVSGPMTRDQVQRGDLLCAAGDIPLGERLDVSLAMLDTAPFALRQLSPVRLYLGAARVAARLYLIASADGSRLAPGESALAQLILERPLACCRGDRFLVRDDSEVVVLGGGRVLDPLAPRSGKARAGRLAHLEAMGRDSPREALRALLENGAAPVNLADFFRAWNLRPEEQGPVMDGLDMTRFQVDKLPYAISPSARQQAVIDLRDTVRTWHRDHPEEPGIRAIDLQNRLQGAAPGSLFRELLSEQLQAGVLQLSDGQVREAGHRAGLSGGNLARWRQLQGLLEDRGLQVPLVSELAAASGMDRKVLVSTLQSAARSGLAVRLNDNRYALPEQLRELAAIAAELAHSAGHITVVDYKQRIGAGRKLAIEILEHFDAMRLTRRLEDRRVLLDTGLSANPYSR